jgi:hypothetical protein
VISTSGRGTAPQPVPGPQPVIMITPRPPTTPGQSDSVARRDDPGTERIV